MAGKAKKAGRQNLIKVSGAILLLFYLTGCAMSYGPSFQMQYPSDGKAMVYIFRSPTLSGSALSATPVVVLNEKPYGRVKNGGYIPIEIAPGEHQIVIKSTFMGKTFERELGDIEFSIAEGEIKYFEFVQITTDYKRNSDTKIAQVETHFVEAPEPFAKKRISRTRLSR